MLQSNVELHEYIDKIIVRNEMEFNSSYFPNASAIIGNLQLASFNVVQNPRLT